MPNKTTGTTIPRGDLKGSLMEHPGKQRYIADILAPVTPVPDKVGVFGVIPVEAFLTMPPSIERAPKAGYNRTEWDLEDQTYRCKEYGHEEVKDDGEAKRYQDYFDYETVLAMRGDTILNVMRERRLVSLLHNETTFPLSGNTGLSLAVEWDNNSSATPIDNIQAGLAGIRARSGLTADTLQVSWNGWRDLWQCDQVRNSFSHAISINIPEPENAAANRDLAGVLGVKQLVVGDAVYNSAAKGQAAVLSEGWSNEYAALLVTPSGPDIAQPCGLRTMSYDADGGIKTVEEYREDPTRSDVIRVRQVVQEKIIQQACIFLFGNCRS
jgi:hypothetical protein